MSSHAKLLERLRARTDTVLLSFSGGKDSLTCWVLLREAGFNVVPFHMELVPGLKFVDDYMDYCEQFFGTHIWRALHPGLYKYLNTLVGQPPWARDAIGDCGLPLFSMDDVAAGVKRTAGLAPDEWHAIGQSANDSAQRRVTMTKYEGIDEPHRRVYPIWDMVKDEKIAHLRKAGVKLPVDYAMFGRSFDGLDWWYLKPIKERYPEDWATIVEWFPMIESELARKEFRLLHQKAGTLPPK